MQFNLVSVISILSGVTGMILGVISYTMSKARMVKEFFEADDSDEMRKSRKEIYSIKECPDEELYTNLSFAKVCSHYHFYGLMAKKHYIPKWVFKGANGEAIIHCYEQCRKYIELRRGDNIYYAEYFEWLYKKVVKNRRGIR